jgi:tungstate transport system permease protein
MEFLLDGVMEAWRLLARGDPQVLHAIGVTAFCTILAVTLAAALALPYGAWLGVSRRDGGGAQVFLMRVGMFVPTIVVGLFVFSLLARRGLLGGLGLLYTRSAIVLGEFLLAFPLMVTLTHGAVASLDARASETARTLGASRWQTVRVVMSEARPGLIAACLVACARCLSELGVALVAGGGIAMQTRTLSATITLELSRGNFSRGLASGFILLVLAVGVALFAHRLGRGSRR